jgi:hypothetical protein
MGKFHRKLEERRKESMITLSFWEQFLIGSAISLLTFLESKVKNTSELAALQAAVTFLQKLLSGNVSLS